MNEIEQDDDEDAIIYSKSDYFDDENNSVEGVNWLQEASEQQLQEEDKDLTTSPNKNHEQMNEKIVNFEDQLNMLANDTENNTKLDTDQNKSKLFLGKSLQLSNNNDFKENFENMLYKLESFEYTILDYFILKYIWD